MAGGAAKSSLLPSTPLHELLRALLSLSNQAAIFLSYSYIEGAKNAEADALCVHTSNTPRPSVPGPSMAPPSLTWPDEKERGAAVCWFH